jgi:hypothetical protein
LLETLERRAGGPPACCGQLKVVPPLFDDHEVGCVPEPAWPPTGGVGEVLYLALNHPLLRHGEGMAFSGLLLAAVAFASTRPGWRKTPSNYLLGKARAEYYLRWPLLTIGVVGLLLVLVAVVS